MSCVFHAVRSASGMWALWKRRAYNKWKEAGIVIRQKESHTGNVLVNWVGGSGFAEQPTSHIFSGLKISICLKV